MTRALRQPYPPPAAFEVPAGGEDGWVLVADPTAPGGVRWVAPMAGRAMSTADFPLTYTVETDVPFQRLEYATGLEWDPVESAFTVPTGGDGDYDLLAEAWVMVNLLGGSTFPIRGHASIHIIKNHGLVDEKVLSDPHGWIESEYRAPAVVTVHAAAAGVPLVAGDTISVTGVQDFICGGAPTTPSAYLYANAHLDGASAQFSAGRIRPARPIVGGDFILPSAVGATLARNNFTGDIGCEFRTRRAISVTHLARMAVGGGAARTVSIVRKSDNVVVATGTTPFVVGGSPDFDWFAITPVTLTGDTRYYLASSETNGSDSWWDAYKVFHHGESVELIGSAFRPAGGAWTTSTDRASFGPPSFRYVPT